MLQAEREYRFVSEFISKEVYGSGAILFRLWSSALFLLGHRWLSSRGSGLHRASAETRPGPDTNVPPPPPRKHRGLLGVRDIDDASQDDTVARLVAAASVSVLGEAKAEGYQRLVQQLTEAAFYQVCAASQVLLKLFDELYKFLFTRVRI